MDQERWARVQGLFHRVAELPEDERRAFLDARCSDDPSVAADVLELLAEDERSDSLLDRGLGEVAGAVLDDGRSVPPRLGPYRLREVLGEGGMGVVYLAERTDFKNLVAIKVLRDAWLSPARRERFASEQSTLAQLNHPSIARLYDADHLPDGTPWFAMEYVDGVALNRYCEEQRCNIRRTLGLFRGVCEAVLHAHQQAVIHRDIKPSNILVTRGGQPKLLDFGIAKQLEGLDRPMERTRTELRVMTPAYAAPEQLKGEGLGAHTDVYSLGAVLYELLAGSPPFDLSNKTPAAATETILHQTPEKPSAAARKAAVRSERPRALLAERGAAWADLDVLCLTALQKDPARRYRSVESLIRDIDHYLRREPLEARPDTAGYRLGKFARRHWKPLSAAAAVTLAVVGLVSFYTVRLTAARNDAVAEAQRTRRIQEFMNGLFEGGDPAAGPRDTLRVVSLLERGVHDAAGLAAEPAVQAELYQTLGTIFQNFGHLDRADSLLALALEIRRTRLGPDHPDVARSLVALALLKVDRSELDEAERLVREGLDMSRRRARSDAAGVARATTALGLVLGVRGQYDDAIEALTEAVRLDSIAGLPAADLVATLTELANNHFYAGHYAVSESLNRRVLEIDRGLYGDQHPNVAVDLVNLGAIQQEWGNWEEAERRYREALAIYRGWFGGNHFETAATLNMVGRTLIQQGRLEEARAPLAEALAIRERLYGERHPSVASTVNELALLAQREGRLDDAEAGFRRMLAIYREAYGGRHYLIGLATANLATVHFERKDFGGAERLFRDALERYAETLPPDHLYVGIAKLKLGRTLLAAGRYAAAEVESRVGYKIVASQEEPAEAWVAFARKDLVAEYEALGRRADADRVRADQEDSTD
jgi:serine/threonine-protein kinase